MICKRNSRGNNLEAPGLWTIKDIRVVKRCSVKKGVLENFTKFTGKHLCQSLFFNKAAGLSSRGILFFKSGFSVTLKTLHGGKISWKLPRQDRSSHRRYSLKKCSEKFRKIHMKTPVLESLLEFYFYFN